MGPVPADQTIGSEDLSQFYQKRASADDFAHSGPSRLDANGRDSVRLPGPLQTEVIYRIAELENVPAAILEEIDQVLQEGISMLQNVEGGRINGIRSAAEILNQMDRSVESAILKGIEEQKQGLADEIRRHMFVFEDLCQADDREVMAILKEVTNEVLQLALKTASEELKEKIFKNMSERAAQMLKEDLEVMGPVSLERCRGGPAEHY